jgi:uncharacterized protein (TIGR02145 family)
LGVKLQESRIEYAGSKNLKQFKSVTAGKTLGFTLGDILHYSVFSGKNNTIVSDSPKADKVYSVEFFECKDQDNLNYPIVKIGNQWWMASNLRYLPAVSAPSNGSSTLSCYYVYGYEGTNVASARSSMDTKGALYNWPAALTACPTGWHLPADAEWTTLENYLGANGYNYDGSLTGNKIAKSMASTTGWETTSGAGAPGNDQASNNSSGFSGLPGGYRNYNGYFYDIGYAGNWWSSTEYSANSAWYRYLYDLYSNIIRLNNLKASGFSVRCVRN